MVRREVGKGEAVFPERSDPRVRYLNERSWGWREVFGVWKLGVGAWKCFLVRQGRD